MNSVNIVELILIGIPEGLLATLALHVFTRTKIDMKNYLILSAIFIACIYLIRLLPITLGVTTILALFVLILCFQFAYKYQLSKIVSSVISAVVIVIMVAVSEELNMIILSLMYGMDKAIQIFNYYKGFTKCMYTFPSTVFLAIFIFIGCLIVKIIDKRKKVNGEASKETGE